MISIRNDTGQLADPWALTAATTVLEAGGVQFRVWAPRCRSVGVRIVAPSRRPLVPMMPMGEGWFEVTIGEVGPGARYFYLLDGERQRPDPVSRAQPEGVHGPSEVVDPAAFSWSDGAWRGRPLGEMVIYEVHVGSFTPAGTFRGVIERLDELRDLGVNALELMPVASFPGKRNWGYDGVCLYAPQESYGGPHGLKSLVDACHGRGLAVILDVVYNHLGPEGNYLAEYGPYFTKRYHTPWGDAVNYDGGGCKEVRRYVVENALYWVTEYHVDALRLDAIHGIFDASPVHILRELNEAVQRQAAALRRIIPVIAESDLNDRRIIDPIEKGGYGLAGQWSDDLHHALHAVLTGERQGYYADFGSLDQLAKALRDGFVYEGQFSRYRGRPHGTPTHDLHGHQFVVCAQNHDQVGNRARGDRLSTLVPFEALKLAAATILLAPNVPLLFMGEEYGETAPFLYFTSFEDPFLGEAVRRGRQEEFRRFCWAGEIPNPQDPRTFDRSRLNWGLRAEGRHAALLHWYRDLLALRAAHVAIHSGDKDRLEVACHETERTLVLHRWGAAGDAIFAPLHFGPDAGVVAARVPPGQWRLALEAAAPDYGGPGSAAPQALQGSAGTISLPMAGWGVAIYTRTES